MISFIFWLGGLVEKPQLVASPPDDTRLAAAAGEQA
jgi:hypothetical protein